MWILCDGTTISNFDILLEWFGISKSVSSQHPGRSIWQFTKIFRNLVKCWKFVHLWCEVQKQVPISMFMLRNMAMVHINSKAINDIYVSCAKICSFFTNM